MSLYLGRIVARALLSWSQPYGQIERAADAIAAVRPPGWSSTYRERERES